MSINARNTAIWNPLTSLEYMGINNPLNSQEATLNNLGRGLVKNSVVIVDDAVRIKEEQRTDTINLGYDKIENEKTLMDMDAATRRAVVALRIAANDYMVLVDKYTVAVLGLIADAKLYAFNAGIRAVHLAEIKAEIAEQKGEIYIQEVDLKIIIEGINRQHVEIELLRAALSVAKAHTRLLMAEIDVKRAELSVIAAEVKAIMADVEKVQIEIDIELAVADIIVRGLTKIKFDIERDKLDGFSGVRSEYDMITDKLEAIQDVISEKVKQIVERKNSTEDIKTDITDLVTAEKLVQDKRKDQFAADKNVFDHKTTKTNEQLVNEAEKTSALTTAREAEITNRTNAIQSVSSADTAAARLVNGAMVAAAGSRKDVVNTRSYYGKTIVKGRHSC